MPYSIIKRRVEGVMKWCVIRRREGNRPQETKHCYSESDGGQRAAEKYVAALRANAPAGER